MTEIQILNNGDTLYDIRRKINENFELVQQEVEEVEEGVQDPIVKFGVNEGNTTDGVADLLDVTDGTLSFKVGGEYPNLVTTSGDGIVTQIESVNDLHLQNLADGEYTIVVNGSQPQITDAEFYSQLLEPENVNDGDVWFNGEKSQQFKAEALTATKQKTNTTTSFHWVAEINGSCVACAGGRPFYISNDNGISWTQFANNGLLTTFTHIGAVVYEGNLYTLGNDKNLYKNPHTQDFTTTPIDLTGGPTNFKYLNGKFVATTQSGYVWYSDDLVNWQESRAIENLIKDITFGNDTYYIVGQGGEVAYSTDLNTWNRIEDIGGGAVTTCIKFYNNQLLIGNNNGNVNIYNIETNETTILQVNSNRSITDIAILPNNILLVITNYGNCFISYDHKTFTSLISVGDIYLRRISLNKFVVGDNGIIITLNQNTGWVDYPYIPIGEVIISDGEVTYVHTYPYNSNGLHEASSSTFGLLRTAAVTDEMDCSCNNAVITPSNLYNISNYRIANTEYKVGDTVGCPYHHGMTLRCTTAGTTSQEALDTNRNLNAGETIIDGTVVWTIETTNTSNFLNKQQITNCLLEVPQRIKYELTDGTLTVKAGSVVIVPYGNLDRTFYKVGDVTFDETTSIASNFSATNYIETHDNFTLGDTWEIVTKFTTGDDITTNQNILSNGRGVALNIANSKLSIYLGSDGSTFDIASAQAGTTTLSANTTYMVKISYDGTVYTMSSSIDGAAWTTEYTSTTEVVVKTGDKLKFGFFSGNIYFRGSIDFSETLITIDGKQRFNTSEQLTTKYPKGSTFLNDNFKVADTQFADGKFFVWAELVGDVEQGGTTTSTSVGYVLMGANEGNIITRRRLESGVSTTTASNTYTVYYNTNTNLIGITGSDTTINNGQIYSLPHIIIMSDGTNTFSSVTQVFNGMGYIGSTYWIDKGVKGLIPNGRNTDGSLNNIEFTTPKLATATLTAYTNNNMPFGYNVVQNKVGWSDWLYVQEEKPNDNYSHWYKPSQNILYYAGATTGDYQPIKDLICGFLGRTDGMVTEWNPKEIFHAVDYNDLQEKVSKSGDTMTGNLKIDKSGAQIHLIGDYWKGIDAYDTNVDCTNTTQVDLQGARIISVDKNGTWYAYSQHGVGASGQYYNSMAVRRYIDGTAKQGVLAVNVDKSGNIYTSAPTPATGDNSTKIATTAFCKNMATTTKATTTSSASATRPAWIVQNYKSGTTWRRVWSDGWIEQGGKVTVTRSNYKATLTFSKAFSDTNYNIMFTAQSSDAAYFQSDNINVSNDTSKIKTTSIEIASEAGNTFYWMACGY